MKDGQKLPGQDSNLGQRSQSPLCYHYTTGQRYALYHSIALNSPATATVCYARETEQGPGATPLATL